MLMYFYFSQFICRMNLITVIIILALIYIVWSLTRTYEKLVTELRYIRVKCVNGANTPEPVTHHTPAPAPAHAPAPAQTNMYQPVGPFDGFKKGLLSSLMNISAGI
jgi:hypothetical protein